MMRKIYHVCLSSHEEVMFRSERDYAIGFNCLAEAAFHTGSKLLADGFMSTHWHTIVQTEDPAGFVQKDRYAYTRFFNAAYGRKGRLAEKDAFITEIEGIHRLTAALNYVNRQGLHHGVSATPFGYPHCSVNTYFQEDLGRRVPDEIPLILPERRHRFLTRNTMVPNVCRMGRNGQLLREDIIDAAYVEQIYITPRNYLFQMNRLSDERSLEEQKREQSPTPIITIAVIEKGTTDCDVRGLLTNEQGRINKSMMTDLELCRLIDDFYLPWLSGKRDGVSVYSCSSQERDELFDMLRHDIYRYRKALIQDGRTLLGRAGLCGKTASDNQIRRCLALPSMPTTFSATTL